MGTTFRMVKFSHKLIIMRTRKELLTLLRDKADVITYCFGLFKKIEWGLCYEVDKLYKYGEINIKECNVLLAHIKVHRPKYFFDKRFGWRPGAWRPRLEWLNKEIERLP